ncbi:MAG: hypothetical protein WEE64_04700 [Dehalococcoidia bacterium]
MPQREHVLQIARLIGIDAFTGRFGPPQTAEPDDGTLRGLIDERLDDITRGLIEEAAASDDVLDPESALSYLDDRLRTLDALLSPEQAARIRASFTERTQAW